VKVRVSDRALRHLAAIYEYIAYDSAEAASRVIGRLQGAVRLLDEQPRMGRESQLRRRRELVVEQYVIIYTVRRDEIVVETIVHGARRR